MSNEPATLLIETKELADRILSVALPPRPLGGSLFIAKRNIKAVSDSARLNLWTYQAMERGIQALFLAYSLQWFRYGREVKAIPTSPKFSKYKALVRLFALERLVDWHRLLCGLLDELRDGEVSAPTPEERVADLLIIADSRRMEAEQGAISGLTHGFIHSGACERPETAVVLLTFARGYLRERDAQTNATLDARLAEDIIGLSENAAGRFGQTDTP